LVARILVADNDRSALDLAMLDLRLEGHTVLGVADGESALVTVAKMAPDVVVLDYRMPPGPSGLTVARRLRALHPDLRIVLYTNYPDADLVRDALEAGVVFLAKGDIRRLRAAVAT